MYKLLMPRVYHKPIKYWDSELVLGSVVAKAPPGDKNVQPVTLRTSVTQTALLLSSKMHLILCSCLCFCPGRCSLLAYYLGD